MDTYQTVLYVHLLSLLVGFGAGSVLSVCLFHLKAAQTLADAVPWATLAGKTEKAFPVAILGLFLTGAYMTSDVWSWSTGWILVSLFGLILVALQGPLVGGRAGKQLERALHANGPGPLGDEARRATRHPGLWVAEFANVGVVLGVIWNMTQKPGTFEAILAVLIGYGLGAAVALRASRPSGEEAPRVAETIG